MASDMHGETARAARGPRHRAQRTVNAAHALQRAARALSHAGGPGLFEDLVHELSKLLGCDAAFVAAYADQGGSRMKTLAAMLDGRTLRNFEYVLEGSPCATVLGREFHLKRSGVRPQFPPSSLFGAKGMDSYAAWPMNDSQGLPLGMLVAMSRTPIEDAELAEALLRIFAARITAEIERQRADDVLRGAALAVSTATGEAVLPHLADYLAATLRVEISMISLFDEDMPSVLSPVTMRVDGNAIDAASYPLAGSPCERVVTGGFRCYPSGVQQAFPTERDLVELGAQSYAGYPVTDRDGRIIGVVAVMSRRPLTHVERVESMLKIFAVRIGTELERQRAEDALRASEASYRAIFEATEDAIFVHDWDTGAVLDVNPKACEVYGFSHEEMVSIDPAQLCSGEPPYTAQEAMRRIDEARRGLTPAFEWHRRNRDGSLCWDEVRLKAVTIGGAPRIVAFTRDITERKLAVESLRAREEQYRVIFEGSADAMAVWNARIRIVDVNRTFEQMYGYQREELIGKGFGKRRDFEDVEGRVALIRRALAGEEGQLETRTVRKSGERFEVELRYLPIRYRDEPHVLAVARDISERSERERSLQRSEARLRATVEAAFDCVVGVDSGGRVIEFNAAAERCFGYLREQTIGRPLVELIVPPRHRRAYAEMIAHFQRTGDGRGVRRLIETTAMRADGTEFPVELAIGVAKAPGGDIFIGYIRDISERRRAEAQRTQLETQLRQAQKMEAIGQVTGGIAHDFNNILTSVTGYVSMAGERAADLGDARLTRQLDQALHAAQRARDLILQMLTFSRGQRGSRRPLALAPVIRQSAQFLRSMLPATVELETVIDDESACAVADPVQIEQVLLNLCINARDAIDGTGRIGISLRTDRESSPAPAPAIERDAGADSPHFAGARDQCASCRATLTGRWLEIAVSDDGSGIEPRTLERMFEPFFTTKEVGRGSGMGLSMVHGIVHEHGGHVLVDSRPGAGTTFRIVLPACDAQAADRDVTTTSAAGARDALTGRVLLVEDEPMVAEFMTERLTGWGLDVTACGNAAAALEALHSGGERYDLLITDQTMPRMTGLTLASRAREIAPRMPVILYSGYADGLTEDALAKAGVRKLLRKPVETAELLDTLRVWLKR